LAADAAKYHTIGYHRLTLYHIQSTIRLLRNASWIVNRLGHAAHVYRSHYIFTIIQRTIKLTHNRLLNG